MTKKNSKSSSSSTSVVRNFFNRVVTQVSSKRGFSFRRGGRRATSTSSASSTIANNEERIKEWKRRFESRVPGVIGIRNHGNTCFINAILQCLSYTDILAEYFVLDQYKYDLKRKRRINNFNKFKKRQNAIFSGGGSGTNAIVNGKNGEITEQLAMVLKSLWSLEYEPEISVKFKALIEKYGAQYKGGTQQDAQEFLLWLLDRVHEDLNTATKRKYKKSFPYSEDSTRLKSDEDLANEALNNYMRCNSSFVMDVFQAQFRSSLTCPSCERQSNTFDPFLCVSLPIPQRQLMPVYVIVLYIDQSPRQVKLGLTIGVDETIADLRRTLAKDIDIPVDQLILTQISDRGFQRSFNDDSESVSILNDGQGQLYCIEVPKLKNPSEDDGAFVVLTWINVLKINDKVEEKRFGTPYALQVSRETIYCDLQKLLMKEMSPILHDDVLIGVQKTPLFKIRVVDTEAYLDADVELPMYTESIERAVTKGGPPHVKLVLEWDALAKSQIINDDSDPVQVHSSVGVVEKCPEDAAASVVSLQDCFDLYTSEERLGQGNAWFCPECNRKREVVKKMGLWSVPDVLVIHLKRFRQCSSTATDKLVTLVEFPLERFDMSPNVSRTSSSSSSSTTSSSSSTSQDQGLRVFAFSPWKNPKRYLNRESGTNSNHEDPPNYVYDLYAVCNHHGTDLQGGHYTATCRNPTDGQWYNFDDVRTKLETEIVTQDAYILFYQRRSSNSVNYSSSSSSSSTSSTTSEHWVYRMPHFKYKMVSTTKSNVTHHKEETPPNTSPEKEETFRRNSGKYATLPNKRSSDMIKCELEHFSDGEPDEEDDDEQDEVLSTTMTLIHRQNVIHEEEEEEDVSRPVDKNDVD